MKKLRILVPVHADLVPPESLDGYSDKEILNWKTEYDVCATLRELGHEVRPLGVRDDLGPLREAIENWKPHVAFNLLEEFHGVALYDQHVVSYLELMRQPYTGCNPRGLLLARDKVLAKQILSYHRIATPRFVVYERGKAVKPPRNLTYPLLVKSASEDASLGISQASVVTSDEKLKDRVEFIHAQIGSDALVEEFIAGRELYVGMLGNDRLQMLPTWEMRFTKNDAEVEVIATRRAKWNADYQRKHGVETGPADEFADGVGEQIVRLCKRIYRALHLTGYARIDLRLSPEGKPFVLEANPNPNLSQGEDLADSAAAANLKYPDLLQRIVNLGLGYRAAWHTVE